VGSISLAEVMSAILTVPPEIRCASDNREFLQAMAFVDLEVVTAIEQ